jgi:hypothetical protein
MSRCPSEEEILALLGAEPLPAWTDHLSGCPSCRENVRAISALQLEAKALWHAARIPTASEMLQKARMRDLHQVECRLVRPITLMENLCVWTSSVLALILTVTASSSAPGRLIVILPVGCTSAAVLLMWVRGCRILTRALRGDTSSPVARGH